MPHAFLPGVRRSFTNETLCRSCGEVKDHPFHYGNSTDDGSSAIAQALDIAIDVGIIANAFSIGSESNSPMGDDDLFSGGGGGDFGGGGASSDW